MIERRKHPRYNTRTAPDAAPPAPFWIVMAMTVAVVIHEIFFR